MPENEKPKTWAEQTKTLLSEMGLLSGESGAQLTTIPGDLVGFHDGDDAAPRLVAKSWLQELAEETEQQGTLPLSNEEGEPVPLFVTKVTDADKQAQQSRSKKYHIAIKEATAVTIPKKWRDKNGTDEDFADPVNHKLWLGDQTHVQNALSRWQQIKDQYSSDEQRIIERRLLKAAKQYDIDASSLKQKSYSAAERAALSGLAGKYEESFTPPETLVDYQDDPQAFGDFLRYTLPMHTKEAALQSIRELPQHADQYDAPALTTIQSRLTARMFEHLAAEPHVEPPAPLTQKEAVPAQPAQVLARKQAGDQGAGEDGEDPGTNDDGTQPDQGMTGDPDDAVWGAMVDLALAFVSAARGLDQLAEQTTDNGALDSGQWANLKKQLFTGLDRLYAQLDTGDSGDAGEETDVEQKMLSLITKEAFPALSDDYAYRRSLHTKAGARHSKGDMAALARIHDSAKDLGYDGCTPKFGSKGAPAGVQKKGLALPGTEGKPIALGHPSDTQRLVQSLDQPAIQALIDQAVVPLRAELTAVQGAASTVSSEVARLHDELTERDDQLDQLRDEREQLRKTLADREDALHAKQVAVEKLEAHLREPLPGVLDRQSPRPPSTPIGPFRRPVVTGKPLSITRANPSIETDFGPATPLEEDDE